MARNCPSWTAWIAGLLMTAVAAIALPATALAKQLAFVIGNDAYQEISPLSAGVNDARAMSAALKRAGFEIELVENGTQRQISRALAAVEGRIAPGDTVLFHYSGHGFEIDGQNWLLPVDVPAAREGEAGLVKDAAFNAAEIIDRLRARGAGTVVAILDACRNNPFARPGTRALVGSQGLARMDASNGVFIMFSAGSKQQALDKLSPNDPAATSIFVRSFLPLVERTDLTLIDIAKETQAKVRDLARSIGHEQIPAYYDGIVGRVNLTGALPAAKPAIIAKPDMAAAHAPQPGAAEDVFWQSIEGSTQPAMFEAYLAQVRGNTFSGTYRKLAELRLAALRGGAPSAPARAEIPSPKLPPAVALVPAPSGDPAIAACDNIAADSRDTEKPAGLTGGELAAGNIVQAISACARAAEAEGAPRRVFYQLARTHEANGNRIDAHRFLQKAVDLGHPLALYVLADKLLAGQDRPRDASRALALFYRAADAGISTAIVRIGLIYANGQGTARDHAKAVAFYNLALKLNEPTVYPELAAAYLNGRGVLKDIGKACQLFRQGAAAGNAASIAGETANCAGR
jgi:TPR repeat protein